MIHKVITDVTQADLEQLIANEVSESRTIEYKRALNLDTTEQKREFLADVSSFANAEGGDLIIGLDERDGMPKELVPLIGFNQDNDRLRIENIIRDGIDPRISGLSVHAISGPFVIIRVPRSWAAPHGVILGGGPSRFFSRNSGGKYPMNVTDLRLAFLMSEQMPQQVRRWRDKRLSALRTAVVSPKLSQNTMLVIHIVPFTASQRPMLLHVNDILEHRANFPPPNTEGLAPTINLDGVLFTEGRTPPFSAMCQIFRSGAIEAIWADVLSRYNLEEKLIPAVPFESALMKTVSSYLSGLGALQVAAPVFLMLSLLDVQEASFHAHHSGDGPYPGRIDRPHVIAPEVLIDDLAAEVPRVIRPALDALWNASGWRGSPHYDDAGNWNPTAPRR